MSRKKKAEPEDVTSEMTESAEVESRKEEVGKGDAEEVTPRKRRGRKPKAKAAEAKAEAVGVEEGGVEEGTTRKRRGRKPKAKAEAEGAEERNVEEETPRKRRGRKPKAKVAEAESVVAGSAGEETPRKRRGRKASKAKGKKRKGKSRKSEKEKTIKYYRDGEVVGDVITVKLDDGEVERCRMVMLFCPDPLLREIDCLGEFNYVERSDFITISAQMLLEYLESLSPEKRSALLGLCPAVVVGNPDDILMSQERYPYVEEDDEDEEAGEEAYEYEESEEDDGSLWCAEDEDEPGDVGGED